MKPITNKITNSVYSNEELIGLNQIILHQIIELYSIIVLREGLENRNDNVNDMNSCKNQRVVSVLEIMKELIMRECTLFNGGGIV